MNTNYPPVGARLRVRIGCLAGDGQRILLPRRPVAAPSTRCHAARPASAPRRQTGRRLVVVPVDGWEGWLY